MPAITSGTFSTSSKTYGRFSNNAISEAARGIGQCPNRVKSGHDELSDARLIKLPRFVDPDGDGLLVVTEAGEQVPFHKIQRMFTIVAPAGAKRGHHAHRLCSQFLLCVSGAFDVVCDDGRDRKTFSLDQPELALSVPPGLWLEIDAKQNDSTLIVLCDRLYEAHDYIHDYAEFLSFRKVPRA